MTKKHNHDKLKVITFLNKAAKIVLIISGVIILISIVLMIFNPYTLYFSIYAIIWGVIPSLSLLLIIWIYKKWILKC